MLPTQEDIEEKLRLGSNKHLFHREGQTLEFKEQFNFAGLADYFRDFAAFSNNKGGILIFGVKDSPRELIGMTTRSIEQFEKIDPETISNYLNEIFSVHIEWEQCLYLIDSMSFGVFYIKEAGVKPVIAKKDEGKDNTIKNGEVYFRYAGRTQKIRYPELEAIINLRIKNNNRDWLEHVKQIGLNGPTNKGLVDFEENTLFLKNDKKVFVDSKLIDDVNLVREGEFTETSGEKTLKLVGRVTPVDTIEVIKEVRKDRLKDYPLSATELAEAIIKKCNECGKNKVWEIIKTEKIKDNPEYATYTFNKASDLKKFEENGTVSKNALSIYKPSTVDHIINLFKGT